MVSDASGTSRIGLSGPSLLKILAQVAIVDTVCIVALPLAIDSTLRPRGL